MRKSPNQYLILAVACLLIFTNLQAKQISVSTLPLIGQLPSNSVQRVYQDKDGYMWFGTLDGLCRYDAYRITVFRSDLYNPNLLTNNEITCMAEDNNNNLWIGTKGGINILNKKTYQIAHFNDENIQRRHIKAILTASDGTIWVGASNSIYRYNADFSLLKHYVYDPNDNTSLPSGGISSIYEDSYGDIWISLWRMGLHKYDKATDSFIHFPFIGNMNNPFRVFQDNKKQFWICTWGDGVYLFNPNKNAESMYTRVEINNKERNQPEETFYSITQDDSSNYIWLMSFSGLFAFEYAANGDLREVDVSHLFKESNNIFSEIGKSRDGSLWIGTFSEGVLTIDFDKPDIKNYPIDAIKNKVKATTNITSMYEDKEGVIWFNQNRIGLCFFDPNTNDIRLYTEYPQLKDHGGFKNIVCMKSFSKTGEVFLGVENQPVVYIVKKEGGNASMKRVIDLSAILSGAGMPQSFFEDSKNNMWVATSNSVFMKPYNEEDFKLISSSFGSITEITEDSQGAIWISSESSGVYKIPFNYNDSQKKLQAVNYSKKSGDIISDNIQAICADQNGKVWIGCKEGNIIVYDIVQQKFEDYSQLCGMSGEAILNIVNDNFGHIWISTNKKITEYNPLNKASCDYSTSDGIYVNSFLKNSYFRNPSGRIYFGGNRGFCSFTPSDKLTGQAKDSEVLISDIKIQNQSVFQGNMNNKFDITSQKLILDPNDRNIEIDFSSLNYTYPAKVQYAYKMEGVDDDWIYTSTNRQFATYNQLNKGTYTFYIKATDENRLWGDHITKLVIVKKPAFYETWWAYLIYTALIGICLYFAIRTTTNRIKLRNELKIAQIEKDKSEELTQTKLRYFTNISHDFLTPLTIISCLIDDIETASKKKIPQFEVMRSNINRLKRLLQQVLDFRKVESGNMKIKISTGDVVTFVKDICYTHFLPLVKKKNIHFDFNAEPNQIQAYFDADKIDKIVFNLLSNAFKYTPADGNVKVEMSVYKQDSHQYLTIKVIDTGTGIAPEDLNNIFTRFFYNKKTDASQTNGIGLSLTKDLVDLHHGTIKAESELGKGSVFTVEIPIDKDSYGAGELSLNQVIIEDDRPNAIENDEEMDIVSISDTLDTKKESINILLVEDNEELLLLIKNILSKRYNVFTATNGLQALEQVKENNIDIIVSDIMMPEMDGLELCRTVKKNLETSHISIILLTAKNSIDDRIESYNAGADGYISKPFELKVLEARINNFVANKKNRQQEFKSNVEINISSLEYPSIDEQFLTNAIKIIENHLSETEFDVNTFADHLNMSKSSLYRKIKTMTGLSPIEFIRNIRLKHASQMLKEKSISVAEVAYSVGFSDPKYFTSCFKNEFNITPSEYQKSVN